LVEVLDKAQAAGKTGEELAAIENKWVTDAGLKLYGDAVADAIKISNKPDKNTLLKTWNAKVNTLPHDDAKAYAKSIGFDLFWDWDAPRTREGYYRYQGGTRCAINRAVAYAPYTDLIWMETKSPIYAQAKEFAEGVLAVHPEIMLAYNLSPSFNWDAAGMNDQQIRSFIWDLGKLGFAWQFITLAGFHSDALGIDVFARNYAKEGMLAYVAGIQRQERANGVETLQHQTWSGANYYDSLIKTVQGGIASTAAMGKGVTEDQFKGT